MFCIQLLSVQDGDLEGSGVCLISRDASMEFASVLAWKDGTSTYGSVPVTISTDSYEVDEEHVDYLE